MSPRPPRQRPSGQQLPNLRPNVQPLRVGSLEPPESGSPGAPEFGTTELPDSGTTGIPESERPGLPNYRPSAVPESRSTGLPKYRQMERHDARLHPEQLRALRDLTARIKAQRHDRRERITDNTLLRIAVDLLLARGDELAGDTEHALRASIGLPNDGTSGVR